MTAVEAAVRPTNAAIRITRYLAKPDFVVMSRPPKFVAQFIEHIGFRFAARRRPIGFLNRLDCCVRKVA